MCSYVIIILLRVVGAVGAHFLDREGVIGSNPIQPTIFLLKQQLLKLSLPKENI